MREYLIVGATDTATGTILTGDEARDRGIVDEAAGLFLNTKTGEKLPLSDAVEAGLIVAEFDEDRTSTPCETKTYAVSAVMDQILSRPVSFPEAVRRHLIDRDSGCYVNNLTGEKVFAAEAIRRGLFQCTVVDDTSSLTDIDVSSRVVVDKIDRIRKNVLRSVNVLAAFKQQAQQD
jgi:enoyl-CoA hydratase/carnithine racemase